VAGTARVRCVVQSACVGGLATFTELPGGLQLTEWHPVRDARGCWRFPNLLGRRLVRPCAAVYNLVLCREHVAMVNGVPCCTLGHGMQGPVIAHPYWGTAAVLDDLAARDPKGWARGHVILSEPLIASRT